MNSDCRLCLTKCEEFFEIFSEYGNEQNIPAIITKYFWFEILEDNKLSSIICKHCWWNIDTFNKFYNNIEAIHNNGQFLINSIDTKTNHIKNIINDADKDLNINNLIVVKLDENVNNNYNSKLECFGNKNNSDKNAIEIHTNVENEHYNNGIEPATNTVVRKTLEPRKRIVKNFAKRRQKEETVLKRKYNKNSSEQKLLLESEKNDKLYQKEINLKKYNKEDDEIREYFEMNCELCSTTFYTLLEARRHYPMKHNISGYLKCCGRKFFYRYKALDHIIHHLNPETHKCKICNKTYVDKISLKSHMEYHAPPELKQFKCELCASSFTKKCKLSQHIRSRHSQGKEKKFICDICEKCFITKSILASHIRGVHQSASRQVCDVCAKIFKSKKVLEDHCAREHLNIVEPRVQCSICGAWLKHKHCLRKHMYRHNNIPVKCLICDKIKPHKDALRKHMRAVHIDGLQTHKCSICNKSFKKAIVLKEHMASHTGEDLYMCPYCPRTFKSCSNMHKHRKRIHPYEWERDRGKRLDFTIDHELS